MYEKHMLSLNQVRQAMNAMLDKATQEPNRPVAIAIVDDTGSLLNYARMDGCRTNPQTFATRKAYTAAMSGRDSGTCREHHACLCKAGRRKPRSGRRARLS